MDERVKALLEILQILFLQMQIYIDGLCHAASSYAGALPFDSIVEPEYKDEKTHMIFDDEMIRLDYFDNSKRMKKCPCTQIQNSKEDHLTRTPHASDKGFSSREIHMDDWYFGIIE